MTIQHDILEATARKFFPDNTILVQDRFDVEPPCYEIIVFRTPTNGFVRILDSVPLEDLEATVYQELVTLRANLVMADAENVARVKEGQPLGRWEGDNEDV